MASARSGSRETPCSRLLMIVLAFVALAIQSLVVQSHIHLRQTASKIESVNALTLAASATGTRNNYSVRAPRDKYPSNEDPSNCPLCQEFGYSGQFVAASSALVSLPYYTAIIFVVFSEATPALFAVSHSWHGRAPPQL
jgi:hypothetical protein